MSDIRLILTENGSRLQFHGGRPLVDDGLENLALISLFTARGWAGNKFLTVPIGSDFEEVCNQPITLRSLDLVRNSAQRALASPAFGRVDVSVTNPSGQRLNIAITLYPPGENPAQVVLSRRDGNWYYQALRPAYPAIDVTRPTGRKQATFGGEPAFFGDDPAYF